MVSRVNLGQDGNVPGVYIPAAEYRGLSTDTKPVEPPNGSTFWELDTDEIYAYDQTSDTWIKQ